MRTKTNKVIDLDSRRPREWGEPTPKERAENNRLRDVSLRATTLILIGGFVALFGLIVAAASLLNGISSMPPQSLDYVPINIAFYLLGACPALLVFTNNKRLGPPH